MVLKGVKGKVNKDYIETWAYPSKSGYGYKLTHKVWKNYCPLCKASGKLKFNPKKVAEGEITCEACDADYCAVSGKDKATKVRGKLKPSTTSKSSSSNTKSASTSVQKQKCDLSKAEAKSKGNKLLSTTPSKTYNIDIPLISGLNVGDYININNVDGFSNGNYYINSIKEDLSNGVLSLSLLKGKFHYGMSYNSEYIVTNPNGSVVASSSKNPYKAKSSYVNKGIGVKANSSIEKKIMLKGKELGSIKKIYKYLLSGVGKFKYKYYLGHYYKGKSENVVCTKSLKKCWSNKFFNCVDGAWIFMLMCKGAGVKMSIVKTQFTYLNGKKASHMYNKYIKTGKYYDVTNTSNVTPSMKKIEKVV